MSKSLVENGIIFLFKGVVTFPKNFPFKILFLNFLFCFDVYEHLLTYIDGVSSKLGHTSFWMTFEIRNVWVVLDSWSMCPLCPCIPVRLQHESLSINAFSLVSCSIHSCYACCLLTACLMIGVAWMCSSFNHADTSCLRGWIVPI